MWRTRGPRPFRGLRCCSTSRIIIRRAVKSQVHDGLVGADPSGSHVEQPRSSYGLQVTVQHLPSRPQETQHAVPLHGPASSHDNIDLPALHLPERPVTGDRGECSCDSEPSTSGRVGDTPLGIGRWRHQHSMNSRDAAALTQRITRAQSMSELHAVVRQYRSQLNYIHISAAIVKLAKLTASERRRQRSRRGMSSGEGQRQHRLEPLEERTVFAGTSAAYLEHERTAAPCPTGSVSHLGLADGWVASAAAADTLQRVRRRGDCRDEGQDSSMDSSAIASSSSSVNRASISSSDSRELNASGSGSCPTGAVGGAAIIGNPSAAPSQPFDGILAAHPQQGHLAATAAAALPSSTLLDDLVSGFLTQLPNYSARQYANVVWALGSMGSRDHPELLQAAAMQLQEKGGAKLFAAPPQELSNLALGLAKLGYREVHLWGAIIAAGKARLHEFKPQELHNLAWAVAAASQDRSMISAAVQVALPQLRRFNASGLSNLLWACATAQCHCEELFDGAAAVLMELPPHDVNYQDMANTAWACAKLQHNHPQLMAHLARLLLSTAAGSGGLGLRAAATQELVNILWAFAMLPLPLSLSVSFDSRLEMEHGAQADSWPASNRLATGASRGSNSDRGLRSMGLSVGNFCSSMGQAERQHDNTQGQGQYSTTLRLQSPSTGLDSMLGLSDVSAVTETPSRQANASSVGSGSGLRSGLLENAVRLLVSEVSRRRDLTPQGASNALWACARLQPCSLPPAAVEALLKAAARCCIRMNDQEIANSVWAIAELHHAGLYVSYGALESMFAVACGSGRLETMAPSGLAQLVHAAVTLRRVATGDMDSLAQHVLRRLSVLGPQEVCVIAVAVAEAVRIAKYCNPLLLNGLANAAVAHVNELCPQGMSTLLWSFARAKHYHGPLTTALCCAAKPRLREFSDMEISNLVWALAVLKCQDRQLLVAAARVLVERVRLRRQRRIAALRQRHALVQSQRSPSPQQQPQQHDDPQQTFLLLLDQVPASEEIGEDQVSPQERHGQKDGPLSERTEMAMALASHRQQQRRRRQQQRRQTRDGGPALEFAPDRQTQGTPEDSDVDGLTGEKLWQRGDIEVDSRLGRRVAPDSCSTSVPMNTPSTVVASSVDDGDNCNGTLAPALGVLPTPSQTSEESMPLHAEPRLRLRRLPSLHHHHDDVDLALQPPRPPTRDACSDATVVDARRRGSGGAVAVGMPRCTGSSDAAGGISAEVLPQRAASSTDEADGDARIGDSSDGAGPTACDHAKSMAKLLWSYAKCSLYNQSLFRLLVQELQPVLRHTTPHELALSLWSVACHGHRCPEFLDAAAALLLQGRLQQFCAWDASVVAWAYAKLDHQDCRLFEALQEHARATRTKYKEPCLLRLAWACTTMGVPLQEDLVRRLVGLKQQSRRRVAYSSYDGADGEVPAAADAARIEE